MHTTWIDQDHEWEAGAKAFAVSLLEDDGIAAYVESIRERAQRNVLGMTLLKLTTPGVPDIYQGDEFPFLALVDPDNRRPVDWELLRRQLASTGPPLKLDLIRRTLALRARRVAAFAGRYEPLEAGDDVCAFVRGGEVLVAVAVRGDLSDFGPPPGVWSDVVRTESLLLAERS